MLLSKDDQWPEGFVVACVSVHDLNMFSAE